MKRVLAFVLACVASGLFFSVATSWVRPHTHAPISVIIDSKTDSHDVEDAINSLHRQDVGVVMIDSSRSSGTPLQSFISVSLGSMMITGVGLLFYKACCAFLRLSP